MRRSRSAPAVISSASFENQAVGPDESHPDRREDNSDCAESRTPTDRVASRSRSPALAFEDPAVRQLRIQEALAEAASPFVDGAIAPPAAHVEPL
eukprot:1830053-Heterocapsa_arctica.AAC.1